MHHNPNIFVYLWSEIKRNLKQGVYMANSIDNNDTRELIGFYQMGLDSIIQGDYSIACFDGKDSSWKDEGYHPSTEYIIVIEKSDVVKYQKTIDSFFGIASFAPIDNKLYIGCGDKISKPIHNTEGVKSDSTNHDNKKSKYEISSHTKLPMYLDNLIYGEFFGAKYQPDYQRYEYNLNLTEEDLLIYLGTYFPRSFGESLCIFSPILRTETVNSELSKKDCINILDIGCGSGGEILGLLHVLENVKESSIPINIYSFDGNQLVQDILMELVSQFQKATKTKRRIQIYTNVQRIDDISDIETVKTYACSIAFDFILCNKMCNELISKGNIANAYEQICNSFAPLLDGNGLMLLLDVTTKDENNSKFYPEILNEQVNKFVIRNNTTFSTLLPLSCAIHPECINSCFTQQKFYISHSQKQNDISKVAYRIIARKTLCEKFMKEIGSVKEIVRERIKDAEDSAFCPLT